jgi:cephalosporin-C deacetylase-like acetyl esterase
VVDLRRAFDVLLARPDVDSKRLAYVGHSYGAQWGAILMAVDQRMKTAVLVGGVPTMASVVLESDNPELSRFQSGPARKAAEEYIRVMSVQDAIRYIPYHAPIPVLFQFARFEQYAKESASEKYYDAATEPKRQKWYNTGHDLNDLQVLLDRAAWLEKEIRMQDVASLLQKQIR